MASLPQGEIKVPRGSSKLRTETRAAWRLVRRGYFGRAAQRPTGLY